MKTMTQKELLQHQHNLKPSQIEILTVINLLEYQNLQIYLSYVDCGNDEPLARFVMERYPQTDYQGSRSSEETIKNFYVDLIMSGSEGKVTPRQVHDFLSLLSNIQSLDEQSSILDIVNNFKSMGIPLEGVTLGDLTRAICKEGSHLNELRDFIQGTLMDWDISIDYYGTILAYITSYLDR